MAFTAKILSWRFRHLNIVGCLLTSISCTLQPTRYSQVTLVSGYPFLQLSIDHNMNVHKDVH